MMGTAVVALPFAFSQTGILLGSIIIFLIGAVACFTCLIIVEYGKNVDEFSDMVGSYLGRPSRLTAWAMSVAVICGAAIVYHILIQESIFQLALTVFTSAGMTHTSWWKRPYAAALLLLVYPLCNMKNMSVVIKFNSLGFLFLWYTIIFVLFHGLHAVANEPLAPVAYGPPSVEPYTSQGVLQVIWGARPTIGLISGMMM
jgi:sodium-coupled neutral amino acid transporter 9